MTTNDKLKAARKAATRDVIERAAEAWEAYRERFEVREGRLQGPIDERMEELRDALEQHRAAELDYANRSR